MKDLDKNFVIDTRMWAMFRKSFNVEFDGFSNSGAMKPFPPTEETAAEFNVKDSYYNMMDRQSGTRPSVGDIGYFGPCPGTDGAWGYRGPAEECQIALCVAKERERKACGQI